MFFKLFIEVFVLFLGFGIIYSSKIEDLATCQHSSFNFGDNHLHLRMEGHVMLNLTSGHRDCARNCMLRRACESINYKGDICELNTKNSTTAASNIVIRDGFHFTDISLWPKILVGTCGDRTCGYHQICVQTYPVATCKDVDCGDPGIPNSILNDTRTVYGTAVKVSCTSDYIVSGPSVVECQVSGLWSEKPTCREQASCLEVKTCNPGYTTDGHYWLVPLLMGGNRVKIYCHGMGTSSPKEYLTVDPTTNFIEDKGGSLVKSISVAFIKIGLDIENMTIIQDDFTFAKPASVPDNGYSPALVYGMAAGCKNTDHGSFSIDTSDTGLIVDQSIQWDTIGNPVDPQGFQRSADGSKITGRCGGYCAWCVPASPLILRLNPIDVVSDEKVITPSCKSATVSKAEKSISRFSSEKFSRRQ